MKNSYSNLISNFLVSLVLAMGLSYFVQTIWNSSVATLSRTIPVLKFYQAIGILSLIYMFATVVSYAFATTVAQQFKNSYNELLEAEKSKNEIKQ